MAVQLHWLPEPPSTWGDTLGELKSASSGLTSWTSLTRLAGHNIDFVQTLRLDRVLLRLFPSAPPELATKPIKLAVLASSTTGHLVPGIRTGGLRRGIWTQVYEGGYGQYWQELTDTSSDLHVFRPDTLLLAFDAHHLFGAPDSTVDSALQTAASCWKIARESFACTIIQQSVLPVLPSLLGNNEHKLPESSHWKIKEFNFRLRELAAAQGTHLLSVDNYAEWDGLKEWHDPALWHRAKQEIHPRVSHMYGDLVGRLVAAEQGRSYKCIALDLDNTLWDGVIGDDGLSGIGLGQGHAVGVAHVEFQRYLLGLARRGVILAVCSKNDEVNARLPFQQHPEMLLKETDIACFVANWNDKAANLRHIAGTLNLGIDSIVFVDDNPFERNLVREALPAVAVPELPQDPSSYVSCLADAGYFEALSLTEEDRVRVEQYRANADREQIRQSSTDIGGYLQALNMELTWREVDDISLPRVVQLINKTNQFNLTTKRYSEADVRKLIEDRSVIGLHLRLTDRFGDNGIIAVVIGKLMTEGNLLIDSWLMSCRVLGRQVEETTLNILASQAKTLGAKNLIGEYFPTPKNGIVKEHYAKLGFRPTANESDGRRQWTLDLTTYDERLSPIRVLKA
jgi:FkbH-like protein